MDFLKIRKKARERAAAREAEGREGPRPEEAKAPPSDPVVTDADVLEGELAARLQGVAPAPDATRFATWRPGEGAPPVQPEPDLLEEAPRPGERGPGVVPATPPVFSPAAAPAAARALDPLEEFFYRDGEEAPAVPALGGRVAEQPEEDPDSALREEYLTFVLGAEEYAVAIERVREVMKSPPITEVPRAPAHVLGVVTVRGEVVAVLDPRRRLGLPPGAAASDGRVVIVDAGDGPCGLLVDRVASVVRLRPGSIEPCPQGIGGANADCLAGIGREGDRLFTVLDLGALLRRGASDRAKPGERHAGA